MRINLDGLGCLPCLPSIRLKFTHLGAQFIMHIIELMVLVHAIWIFCPACKDGLCPTAEDPSSLLRQPPVHPRVHQSSQSPGLLENWCENVTPPKHRRSKRKKQTTRLPVTTALASSCSYLNLWLSNLRGSFLLCFIWWQTHKLHKYKAIQKSVDLWCKLYNRSKWPKRGVSKQTCLLLRHSEGSTQAHSNQTAEQTSHGNDPAVGFCVKRFTPWQNSNSKLSESNERSNSVFIFVGFRSLPITTNSVMVQITHAEL